MAAPGAQTPDSLNSILKPWKLAERRQAGLMASSAQAGTAGHRAAAGQQSQLGELSLCLRGKWVQDCQSYAEEQVSDRLLVWDSSHRLK